jgi:hypothetical protein
MNQEIKALPPFEAPQRVLPTESLALARPAGVALTEAKDVASNLSLYMSAKKSKVILNGEQYIEVDDWQAIANSFGVTAMLESDREVDFDGVKGWEATFVAHDRHGRIVGRATSMCLRDEEHWRARPKYTNENKLKNGSWVAEENAPANKSEWVWVNNPKTGKTMPQKRRQATGEEPVPYFQLRAMAQTRAQSRCLAGIFRFVPTLIGCKTTPAEEIDKRDPVTIEVETAPADDNLPPVAVPPPQSAPRATATTTPPAKTPPPDPATPASKPQETQNPRDLLPPATIQQIVTCFEAIGISLEDLEDPNNPKKFGPSTQWNRQTYIALKDEYVRLASK